MKLLFIQNVGRKVDSFSKSSITAAKELGIEFHIASDWIGYESDEERIFDEKKYGITIHQIDFIRTPYDVRNIKAYKQMVKLIQKEKIDAIHCNTPIGGVVGRLAGKKCGVKKVIYQAHGFHFYDGAPKLNWLVYYPIEKWLAHYTDALITINQEDYQRAQTFRLKNKGKVYYVPGVGIDTLLYEPREAARDAKRRELGLNENDIALISAGDLIERKNYKTAIMALANMHDSKVHYFICGKGPQQEELEKLTEDLKICSQVHFLGYRTDIRELMQAADIFIFTTLQEGLPRSMMEAMASGLPCVASKIRGNIDLLVDGEHGFLVDAHDTDGFTECFRTLADNQNLRKRMSLANIQRMYDFNMNAAENAILQVYKAETMRGGVNAYIPTWAKKRFELGISLEAAVLISVGDLNTNKNNKIVIEAMKRMKYSQLHYILCGEGPVRQKLEQMAEPIKDKIHFLGYRTDIRELMAASDIFVLPSFREGLSRSLMEAMASGLPIAASRIRGNVDLIDNNGGYLFDSHSVESVSESIEKLIKDSTDMGKYNKQKIESFNVNTVNMSMSRIYRKSL